MKYKFQSKTIIHCYDNPHLLKVIRNNLLTKDLHHSIVNRWTVTNSIVESTNTQVASWIDVERLYQVGGHSLDKITDEHIKPDKLKMKVSVATQIFSKTYGELMQLCAEKGHMPATANGTAQILFFLTTFSIV